MIRLADVSVAPGGKTLLRNVSWHIRPGQRVGLVGHNGTGKTTVLRVVAGEAEPDEGEVHRRGRIRVGYLPQHAVSGSTLTLWDEARSGAERLNTLRQTMETAQRRLEAGTPGAVEAHDTALEAWRMAGGPAEDERIGSVLHGLGFRKTDWNRPCTEFSGGWQMRIALVRLLLSEPDVALLDEPTNHLDLHTRTWLARHLAAASHATVIVSHDRYLLDSVCQRIAETRHGTMHHYTGNFSSYVRQRAERAEFAGKTLAKQTAKAEHLQGFIDRFGAKATKASQARSRQKQLDRMEFVAAPQADKRPRLRLPDPPDGAAVALELRGATLGWTTPLLRDVDLVVERGMRLALIGPNGCGKSTLLHSLAGRLKLIEGRRKKGDRIRIGVFTQDLAADLPAGVSALSHVIAAAPATPPQQLRAILGSLGLPGEAAKRLIGKLSGGERARVALAALTATRCNVLLLDEPTNHLDALTVDALVEGLAAWEGALVLVSHDRWVVEQLATHAAVIRGDTVEVHEGLTPADFESGPVRRQITRRGGSDAYAERKQKARDAERARRRIMKIEATIEANDITIAALEAKLFEVAGDYAAAAATEAERAGLAAENDALMTEWEELEAIL
jgi:ATP-binding cassette subfamily F protein 3